jgi:hypothetical protein
MFERQLAGLSARFANVFGDQVRDGNRELKYLLQFLGFDRSNFVESNDTHRPGAVWYLGQIRAGKIMRVQSIDESSRSQSSSP